ncbi:MAG: methylated-DNA--[protein]-cysteine S-methyltransferase [Clostridia bacterium]|nr:methylated-DNA--[protein]-cysteine S-methyltransferase [Clostridia bacterium]
MKASYTYSTKIGEITITEENQKIIEVKLGKADNREIKETKLIKQTYEQIEEYLEEKRTKFTIPISLKGTTFRKKVWEALLTIPYGKTNSYQEIARKIGNPKACRAVGMANHYNPIIIIVPCHRVIGKNGKLVGYGGGLDIKEKLLEIENKAKY